MALDDFNTDQPDEAESSDGENSVAYLYIRRADDEEAYNLMSSKHGGSARVRNALKALNDYEDQHDFFQQFIKSIEPVLYEGNWVPMLEEVGLTAEGIAQYLDEHPEVEEELRELFETTEVSADDWTGGMFRSTGATALAAVWELDELTQEVTTLSAEPVAQ